MNRLLLIFVGILIIVSVASAQDSIAPGVESNMGVGLYSRYVWRGQELGNSPSIQPYVDVSYRGFTLGVAGAYQFSGAGYQEIDIYASKEWGMFKITAWDYFGYTDTLGFNFFQYSEKETGHQLELVGELDLRKYLPLKLLGGYNVFGVDVHKAMYFELCYNANIKDTDIEIFCGFTPHKGAYAANAAITNCGINFKHDIRLMPSLILSSSFSVVCNPYEKIVYLVAGFQF